MTIPASATGSFPYSVSCASANGCLSVGRSATATISPNAPPVLNAPFAPLSTTVGENFRFQFAANAFTDPEGGNLTYTATNLPAWLSFAASTRTFSGSVATAGSFHPYPYRHRPAGSQYVGPARHRRQSAACRVLSAAAPLQLRHGVPLPSASAGPTERRFSTGPRALRRAAATPINLSVPPCVTAPKPSRFTPDSGALPSAAWSIWPAIALRFRRPALPHPKPRCP